jgi:hypothetical protein
MIPHRRMVLATAGGLILAAQAPTLAPAQGVPLSAGLLSAVNQRRISLGLPVATSDPRLDAAASQQVARLAQSGGGVRSDAEWLQQLAATSGYARLYQFVSAGFGEPVRTVEDWAIRQGLDTVLREAQTMYAGAGHAEVQGLRNERIPYWLLILAVPNIR